MTQGPRLRIFFPATAELLTDHLAHGEGLIAYHMLSGLAARGHVIVACAHEVALREPPPFHVRALGHGGPLESLAPLGYAALASWELRRRGGPARFDVAHWLFPQGIDNMLDTSPRRLPLVVGPLMQAWPAAERRLTPGDVVRCVARPVYGALSRRALGHAGRILACAPGVIDTLAPRYRERATVVPFGIHASEYAVMPLPSRPTVLFVGRLHESKGVRELVDAFASVRTVVPGSRLRIAGEGPEAAWLERRAVELGIASSVEFLGRVPHREITSLVADCSLFCMPSHGEPFGMAILEAMAAGRAVVASDCGGPRHLVHPGGGMRVRPRDRHTLAQALITLLNDRARLEAMGAFNRERVEREFSWSVILDALEHAYGVAMTARPGYG
jgi:glycosyltransferase involved in cell wall biosynthesis